MCSRTLKHPDSGFFCRPASENQVKDGQNTISVRGGSPAESDLLSDTWRLTWEIPFAYIMEGRTDAFDPDIGMLIIPFPLVPFFDKEKLKTNRNLGLAKIVPICLISQVTSDVKKKSIRGVGWGYRYQESPDRPNHRSPRISSCMTNEASPDLWKFKECDMQKTEIVTRGWKCNFDSYPTHYLKDAVQCEKLWNDAEKILGQSDRKILDDVDRIKITKEPGTKNEPEVCYNPKRFKKFGWCNVLDYVDNTPYQHAWGFCSPSCANEVMVVSITLYIRSKYFAVNLFYL